MTRVWGSIEKNAGGLKALKKLLQLFAGRFGFYRRWYAVSFSTVAQQMVDRRAKCGFADRRPLGLE